MKKSFAERDRELLLQFTTVYWNLIILCMLKYSSMLLNLVETVVLLVNHYIRNSCYIKICKVCTYFVLVYKCSIIYDFPVGVYFILMTFCVKTSG